jgi:hypothetical protein
MNEFGAFASGFGDDARVLADTRRRRSTRDALERLLDCDDRLSRERVAQLIRDAHTQDFNDCDSRLGARRRQIAGAQAALDRVAGAVAVAGALAVVGLVILTCLQSGGLAVQIGRLLAAGLALAMVGLLTRGGRPSVAVQAVVQSVASLLLLSASDNAGLDLAILGLGWAAIAARGVIRGRARGHELDLLELGFSVRGRDESVAQMRRVRAAAI